MDMTSDSPKILASFGSCQTLRVDRKGHEPDIGSGKVEESTTLLFGKEKFTSEQKRRSDLPKPKNASKYTTDLEHIYTIELYDYAMCFGSYYHHAMGV
jgi:hypothetical protein